MDPLGGKWTVVLLSHLKERPHRYAELRAAVPGITEKVLADRLRRLVADGLVEREQISATPPHVVYSLSDEGRSLEPALDALYAWGTRWAARHGHRIIPGPDGHR